MKIERLLVANRGEIAVRVIRACKELDITSVLASSAIDEGSLPAQLADEVIVVGPGPAAKSYMNIDVVLEAAASAGVQAIHPGYGFLSESSEFAQRCVDQGLIFVGPKPEHIAVMGNKGAAKTAAAKAGVAVGAFTRPVSDLNEAMALSADLTFPILIKAVAGGGGRGMRRVDSPGDLAAAFTEASGEARAVFGDPAVYMESFVERARHIEVQIVADSYGAVTHVGERDCTVQRRFQKVIEEAPPAGIASDVIDRMRADAVALADSVGYENVGTVEFIYDTTHNTYFFIEMNTRIQVEHPVTELLWNVDLVAEQIRIAEGEPLSQAIRDAAPGPNRHVIECRINCEDPARGFMPVPGTVTRFEAPDRDHLRVDSHLFDGYAVPPFYDSMLAKIIVTGDSREQATKRMLAALGDIVLEGVATNKELHRQILSSSDFRDANVHTRWLEEEFDGGAL